MMEKKFMEGRIEMIRAGFRKRYAPRQGFVVDDNEITTELMQLILSGNRIERMLMLCELGMAPLRAVVYDVEKFAENKGLAEDGRLSDEWKQNVGMMIGAIVYFLGYVADGDNTEDKEDLQKLPKPPKYFHYAATFHKVIN